VRANRVLKFRKEAGFKQILLKISSIRPNPFRQLDRYPLDEAKIAKLASSIQRNYFWETVVTRKSVDHTYELAFGHHRIEAARRLFGNEPEIKILVGDLSETQMVQFMAADNDEAFNPAPSFILEVIEAAIPFLGRELSPSPVKAMGSVTIFCVAQ
jgi:ParB-like chromosome segregation protein Spo0J